MSGDLRLYERWIVSPLLGLLDYMYYPMRWSMGRNRPKYFSEGWGDKDKLDAAHRAILEVFFQQRDEDGSPSHVNDLTWSDNTLAKLDVVCGTFTSPLAEYLPVGSKQCRVHRFTSPRESPSLCDPAASVQEEVREERVLIFFPATGEEEASSRIHLSKCVKNTMKDNVSFRFSSYILTAPFYGDRRPEGQRQYFINNVSDYVVQSYALGTEAVALACHISAEFEKKKKSRGEQTGKLDDARLVFCFTGYSWGGSIAAASAIVAAHALRGKPDIAVTTAPYVGSATGAVIPSGIASSDVDWAAVGRSAEHHASGDTITLGRAAARKKLWDYLDDISIKSFVENHVTGAPVAAAVSSSTYSDHFVLPSYGKRLHDEVAHFTTLPATNARFRWLAGGHVWAYLRQESLLVPLINEAFRLA